MNDSPSQRDDEIDVNPSLPDLTKQGDLPPMMRGKRLTMRADMETIKLDRQLKVAHSRQFEFFSDEPVYLRGDDEYPPPIAYLVAGIGFCLLTQVQRLAFMMRKEFTRAICRVEYDSSQDGSIGGRDLRAQAHEVRIDLDLESEDSEIDVLVRLAMSSCFAEALVRQPVPIIHNVTVNGQGIAVE